MSRPDPQLPAVFTRSDAAAKGITRGQVQRRVGSGTWRVLRRGAFCLAATWDAADRHERYRLLSLAALKVVAGPHVISHASAAVLHHLPMPRGRERAWLTTEPDRPTRYLCDLVVESASVPDQERWTVREEPTTSVARTVADCLRHLDTVDAVAIADAALHGDPDLGPVVQRILDRCATWPYAARAARRLPLVDARRESYAESWSYVLLDELGVPLPEPQVTIRDENGDFVARVDALWDRRVVGEVDGLVKYGVGGDMPVEEARLALVREKRREEALTQLGLRVVRWGTKDLARPRQWGDRIRAELARPSLAGVTARFAYSPDARSG
ncbi:MAG: hypothetical protein ACLGIA_07210 [Actinomycetes bacterium]